MKIWSNLMFKIYWKAIYQRYTAIPSVGSFSNLLTIQMEADHWPGTFPVTDSRQETLWVSDVLSDSNSQRCQQSWATLKLKSSGRILWWQNTSVGFIQKMKTSNCISYCCWPLVVEIVHIFTLSNESTVSSLRRSRIESHQSHVCCFQTVEWWFPSSCFATGWLWGKSKVACLCHGQSLYIWHIILSTLSIGTMRQ